MILSGLSMKMYAKKLKKLNYFLRIVKDNPAVVLKSLACWIGGSTVRLEIMSI